jgi:minor curlin subunit
MKKGIPTIAMLLSGMAVYAQHNISTASQTGGGNTQSVSQLGSSQTSSITQSTPAANVIGHRAAVVQTGEGNQSVISSHIFKAGNGSEVAVNQLGQENSSIVLTQGSRNAVYVDQSEAGTPVADNTAYVQVYGLRNEAAINQSGSANLAKIYQGISGPPADRHNEAEINQSGSVNYAISLQFGNNNKALTKQTGDINAAISDQRGDGNTSSFTQSSNGNQTSVYVGYLYGPSNDNRATVTQAGDGGVNGTFVFQEGAGGNVAEVTQDGDGWNIICGGIIDYAVQHGSGNALYARQTSEGTGHIMFVMQIGNGNLIQGMGGDGVDNPAFQTGSSSIATLMQTGNFNTINLLQNGISNNATIAQNGS